MPSSIKCEGRLICFFDVNGIVHKEFVPPEQTVNQYFYLDVLKRLRYSVRRKRPELWRSGDWLLHHDNVPAHTALSVRQFLAKSNMVLLPHPPYSPDLAPCDFSLLPWMKKTLKGKRFSGLEVKEITLTALKSIPCQEFQNCFQPWKERWDKCINSHGEYFEGD
jgi:histone-lysine N-methyltransferase SETMAR